MKIISVTTICLILTCNTAPAPIYGSFEGLNQLVDEAEFVVIAEIIKRPDELDLGSGGVFEIEPIKVLKGDAKEGKRSTAYLRDLQFDLGPHKGISLTHEFIQGQLYLLFLNKSGVHTRDENGKPLPVDFENENCSGDAIWISPLLWYVDLDSLKGKGVREAVIALLNHTANRHREFAEAVGAMIERRAGDPHTQKISQILWLDNNAEEAAKFYLSIFKGSNKDPNIDRYREVGSEPKERFTGVKLWVDGQEIVILDGGSKMKPTKATALTLNCDLQEEIDYYWEKLSAGGEKSRSGWVKDRFGVWWHVVPADLPQLLGDKYGDSERVMNALSKMEKIDGAALRRAAWDK